MKKLKIYLFLFLLSAGMVVFNSCSQENELIEQESFLLNDGISINNGILTFTTVDLYDETIQLLSSLSEVELNKWEKTYSHTSLRSESRETELIKEIGKTFSTLLNAEKEIVIAGNFFKLDFEKGTITKQKWDETCEFKNENMNESSTFFFKDDLDVFDENPLLKSTNEDACGYEGRLWVERNTLVDGHALYRLEYDTWSIFRHVRAEIEPSSNPVKVWLSITAGSENKYKLYNKNQCGSMDTSVTLGGTVGSSSNISYDIYNGTNRLSAYKFKVTFKARSRTTPTDDLDTWIVYLDCATVNCP